MVHLLPKYKSVLKTTKPTKKTITVRTEDSVKALRNCFEITNWSIFDDSCSDLIELNDKISEYIKFCEEIVTSKK